MRITVLARCALVVAGTFLVASAPQAVHAADQVESITLSPTSKKYTFDPGSTKEDSFTILNDGEVAYDFLVYAEPYSLDPVTSQPIYQGSKAANADANTWVSFAQTRWHIDPHQSVRVPFTIRVKDTASPGGHYGVIFAETQPQSSDTQGVSLGRKKRVGMIIYSTVTGDLKPAGAVKQIQIDGYQSQAPLEASVRIENTGNTDFFPTVSYRVEDVFGNTKYQTTSSDHIVLPGITRTIPMSWDQASWLGFYKVTVSTTVLGNTTTQSSYVFVAPQWFILLVVVLIAAGVVYAIRSHQTRRR